jgi:HPt (histidine-containing phosphotransfer) domain-containing protein
MVVPSNPVCVVIDGSLAPIFNQFLDIQRRHLAAMEHALAVGDSQTIERLAHAVKGAAASYQLPTAATMAGRLEALAQNGDLSLAPALVVGLDSYFSRLCVTFSI